MYGTRDAPAVWQRLVRKILTGLGFVPSRTTACVYHHQGRQLKVVAHVDDLLVTGPKPELELLRSQLQAEYEVDGDILGVDRGEAREGRFLGRTIRVQPWGVEIEADQKLVNSLLTDWDPSESAGVDTPGQKDLPEQSETPMSKSEAALFRRGAAQLNYLAQDRLDLSYASKEVARHMARPTLGAEAHLRRVVRYLRRYPRWVVTYEWQGAPGGVTAFTDSDWGGCVRTRRSTSGGALLHGNHLVVHYSRTQQLIALSSAEAELNASIKAAQEGLSLRNLLVEMGEECFLELRGDSSANDGIIKRAGAGKVKHLSVRQLWLQEQAGAGELWHTKIPRLDNLSDVLTHRFTRAEVELHFPKMCCNRPAV